jgi:hypothetical protein
MPATLIPSSETTTPVILKRRALRFNEEIRFGVPLLKDMLRSVPATRPTGREQIL